MTQIPKPKKKVTTNRPPFSYLAHKYGAVKTMLDGQHFPSRLEAYTYAHLKLQVALKLIKSFKRYGRVFLSDAKISYKPDFEVENLDGSHYFVESKGKEMDRWRMIKNLWAHYGPTELHIYKDRGKGQVYLSEIIKPKEQK